MKCSNVIVPGFEDTSKIKDRGLEIKLEMAMEKMGKTPTFKVKPNYKPKSTVKAYKLFRYKNGKIYPLYVKADKALPIGKWLEAEAGDMNKQGKVKASGMSNGLAYRPGWHSGIIPSATHIGEYIDPDTGAVLPQKGNKPSQRRENEVWAEIEVPNDFDWQSEAISRASIVKSGPNKGKPNAREAHITDQLPNDGYYTYKTNSNMEGEWLISGELKVNKILTDEEVRNINAEVGAKDLSRDYEMPYYKKR